MVILTIAMFFQRFEDLAIVQHVFKGIRPGVVALVIAAAFSVGRVAIVDWKSALLGVAGFLLLTVVHVHPIVVIIVSGVAGYFMFRLMSSR